MDRKLQTTERQIAAVRLRALGKTYRDIGTELGVTAAGAWKMIRAALRHTLVETVDELRRLEAERLDCLQAAISAAAEGGDTKAVDCCLRIMDRRARLFGLDRCSSRDTAEITLQVKTPALLEAPHATIEG